MDKCEVLIMRKAGEVVSQHRGEYGHLPVSTQLAIAILGPLTLGMGYNTPAFDEYVMVERAKARHKRRHG